MICVRDEKLNFSDQSRIRITGLWLDIKHLAIPELELILRYSAHL